ncbi:YkvA family protein [Nibrella saemangeumensis]|uniref:YkvA family protein n=1 Tax=Nibrella saemangeumensis TaxID=1084526 RepID=A0ABP8MNR6_9BACT
MANSKLIAQVLASIFFRRSNVKAARYARNSRSLFGLVQQVLTKSKGLTGSNIQDVRNHIALMARMVKAYASGEYKNIPWKSLIRMIAVLIYFVSPLDFIPDFLPIIGVTDDIALVFWLVSAMGTDIEKFRQWEESRKTTISIG